MPSKTQTVRNEEGVRTRRGNLWDGFVIKQVLIDPVYAGANVYGRHAKGDTRVKPRDQWTVVPGKRERLISQAVFDQMRQTLER